MKEVSGQLLPGKFRLYGEYMAFRQQGVLGVAAVEAAAHSPHEGNGHLTRMKRAVGGVGHFSHALNTGDDGLLDVVRLNFTETENLFRMVQTEGPYSDQHPTRADLGDRHIAQADIFRLRRPGQDHGFHRFRDHGVTSFQHWGSAA